MRLLTPLILLLWLPALLPAQGLTAKITGPAVAPPTEFTRLHIETNAEQVRWRLLNSPKQFALEDGGKTLVFITAAEGSYQFVAILVKDAGKPSVEVDVAFHLLTISSQPGPNPPPGPQPLPPTPPGPLPPGPQPNPNPPNPGPPSFPDGQFAVSAKIYEWSQAVQSPGRATEAAALARSLRTVSARISAGTLGGASAILDALKESIAQTLGSNQQPWSDAVGKPLETTLKALYFGGKLKSNASWSTLINELALGLEAVR
jgi:hypothetical protein